MELWKPIPSLVGAEASSHGRVRRVLWSESRERNYGGKPMTGVCGRGKLTATFSGRKYAVHRLVCEAFNGPAPDHLPLCMHHDEVFTNTRPENLAWGTQSENMRAPKMRASWTAEKEAAARRKSWEARRNRYGGSGQRSLAGAFGVDRRDRQPKGEANGMSTCILAQEGRSC